MSTQISIRRAQPTKSYYVPYIFASYVILTLSKALKEFMKMFGQSLFYSRLVILSNLHSKPDSLLSSEKPFSTHGDKINFCVLKLTAGCSTADCSHCPLTE